MHGYILIMDQGFDCFHDISIFYWWFYHTWLITCLWPSLSLCRLFRPHGLILYFDVSKFIPKNTCLLLYVTFNPTLACIHDFWPKTCVHQDVCINPIFFWTFPWCVSKTLNSWPSICFAITQIWPSITPLECYIRNALHTLKERNWRAMKL